VASENNFSAFVPIHFLSILAAVFATPFWITAGKPTPINPFHLK